jgi:hypothetical protein
MENTPDLYETLTQVLRPHRPWWALRPRKTLAWRMGGLSHAGAIRLGAWTPFVSHRAPDSPSTGRRLRRWREHAQLEGHARYGPLLPHAVVGWGDQPRSGAGDPSLWWATSCTGRLSVLDRGRAVPRVWRVIAPGRATGADEGSKARWERAAPWLPRAGRVGLLADRGGAETTLRRHRKPRGGPGAGGARRRSGASIAVRGGVTFVLSPGPLGRPDVGRGSR